MRIRKRQGGKPHRERKRTGAAIVEFAVCLPVFFMICLGTVETCRMMYLRQSLKIAAYECARIAIVPGTADKDVKNQCDAILRGRRIKGYKLKTEPSSVKGLKYGDYFKVSVEMPAKKNAIVGTWFYRNKTLRESVTILVEY